MAKLFLENAYNVLGLDTSASQKEITKRAKDIINLLKIDEKPNDLIELSFAAIERDEASVKEAAQKLSSPNKRIGEYFFWFDIENDTDEKAVKALQEEDIERAVGLWSDVSDKETANGFVAKKNLAIVSSLLLLEKGQKKYLTQSLGYWKDIILSEKFWSHFEKLYALNDEIGTSASALKDFREKVTDELSDFYTDVSQKHNDNSFYSLFSQIFAVKGQKLQKDVLSPIYEAIHDASEKLEKLNISEDNIISDDEVATLKRLTKILQTNFDKLKELGLYNDSTSKTMRDKAAEALRTVALDLYNNLSESAKSIALLNIASKISGTPATINKINKDIEQLRKNRTNEKVIIPINELIEAERYEEALEEIDAALPKHKDNKELTDFLSLRIKWCVTGISAGLYKDGMAYFNSNKFSQAAPKFNSLKVFILDNLHLFNISQDFVDSVVNEINNQTSNPSSLNFDAIQAYRNKVVEKATEAFKDEFEETVLIYLVDSAVYGNLSELIPTIKRKNTIKKWAWWGAIALFFFFVYAVSGNSSSNSDSSSSSSSSSSYSTCKSEYDSLKTELESVESSMSSYNASNDTDSYNELVPQQNDLVSKVNAKAAECNGMR